jgi:hypothetical protein
MTVAEALAKKAEILARTSEIEALISQNLNTTYFRGDELPVPDYNINDLYEELNKEMTKWIYISRKINEANLVFKIRNTDGEITVFEAIEVAKHYRKLANEFQRMGRSTAKKAASGYASGNIPQYIVTNYDPIVYRQRGIELLKYTNELSMSIENANKVNEIEVEL